MERTIIRLAFAGLIIASGQLNGFGQQSTNQLAGIKTNFVAGAQFSKDEVSQVLAVAKMGGILAAGEIKTFQSFPGKRGDIEVKSVGRVDGRDTYFEVLPVEKDSWRSDNVVGEGVKRVGEFTTKPSDMRTVRLRSYQFRKRQVEISIPTLIDAEMVDKGIGLIAESKVKFASDWARDEFEKLGNATPTELSMRGSGGLYELGMYEPKEGMHIVIFKFEKDQLAIQSASVVVF